MRRRTYTTHGFGGIKSAAGIPALHAQILPHGADLSPAMPPGEPSARALVAMSVACVAGPDEWPTSPGDENGYRAFIELMPVMLAVLQMAIRIEPDPIAAALWYRNIAIAELGNLTAAQLVSRGRASEVIAFLRSICDGGRD